MYNLIPLLYLLSLSSSIFSLLDIAGTTQLSAFGINLTPSERLSIFHSFLHGSAEGTLHTLEYILENYIQISDLLLTMDELLQGAGHYVRTEAQLSVLQQIQVTHMLRMTTSVRSIISRELADGTMNRGLLRLVEGQVNQWLQENVPMEGLGNSLVAANCLTLLAAIALIKYVFA